MRKLKLCKIGCNILKISLVISIVLILYTIIKVSSLIQLQTSVQTYILFSVKILFFAFMDLFLLLIGLIMVYTTSIQLGIKWRILGVVFCFIPIINTCILLKILFIVSKEIRFETNKMKLNNTRKEQQICKTKYPILLVHGVFFRDYKYFNYWGRIPKELEENGATIYYGNHSSALSVEDSAKELIKRIEEIIKESGCEKVNIIAHSKGGLDARMAIINPKIANSVASLTTINTPHRGCEFADYLLTKIPEKQKDTIATIYNNSAQKLGDSKSDFLSAVNDLTYKKCKQRNSILFDNPNIFYQSVGSKLNKSASGQFPLNFTHKLVKYFDGENDGLVGEKSFAWGEKYTYLTTKGKRGISHGDVIDLNRENFKGFDVREFYVQLVSDLRERGL